MSGIVALRHAGRSYKEIAREFGVTVDAVKWWLVHGFPTRRKAQLRRALDRAIADNETRLRELREEKRAVEHEEAMAALADSRTRGVGAAAAAAERLE